MLGEAWILHAPPTLDYGKAIMPTLIFVPIPTQTLLDQIVIERVPVELASFLDHVLYLKCGKSIALLLSPLSRQSTSGPVLVVNKSFGCNIPSKI